MRTRDEQIKPWGYISPFAKKSLQDRAKCDLTITRKSTVSTTMPLYTEEHILEAEQLARADAEASKARVKVLEKALVYLEEEARRFASRYTAYSDGWNTFIIFSDKIHARAALTREGGE